MPPPAVAMGQARVEKRSLVDQGGLVKPSVFSGKETEPDSRVGARHPSARTLVGSLAHAAESPVPVFHVARNDSALFASAGRGNAYKCWASCMSVGARTQRDVLVVS